MNLHDCVLEGSIAEDIAIIDGQDNQWTYGRLRSLIAHLSGYLENASNPQDRCLICSDNGVFWLCAFLACARAGRIAVPVAPTPTHTAYEVPTGSVFIPTPSNKTLSAIELEITDDTGTTVISVPRLQVN